MTVPPPGPGATGVEIRARDVFTVPARYPERVKAILALSYANQLRHRLADVERERGKLMAVARVHDVRPEPQKPKPGRIVH